jgi:uncharacterized membrane protein YjjP (DUF1212 family)
MTNVEKINNIKKAIAENTIAKEDAKKALNEIILDEEYKDRGYDVWVVCNARRLLKEIA